MALNPTIAIQTAILATLTGDATLMALITGVFDSVPQNQAFPFITIPDLANKDWGAVDFTGVDGFLTIGVWSQQFSSLECKTIMARIYTLLHAVRLTVTGFNMCLMRMDNEQVTLDPDGITHHGIQRFRYLVTS